MDRQGGDGEAAGADIQAAKIARLMVLGSKSQHMRTLEHSEVINGRTKRNLSNQPTRPTMTLY